MGQRTRNYSLKFDFGKEIMKFRKLSKIFCMLKVVYLDRFTDI